MSRHDSHGVHSQVDVSDDTQVQPDAACPSTQSRRGLGVTLIPHYQDRISYYLFPPPVPGMVRITEDLLRERKMRVHTFSGAFGRPELNNAIRHR